MRVFLKFLPLIIISVFIYSIQIFHALRGHMGALNVPIFINFPSNFIKNILFWFDPGYSDFIATIFATAGFYKFLKDKNIIPAVFAAYLLVYSLTAEPFKSRPDTIRFALTLMPMYCIMAAAGFYFLAGFFDSLKNKKKSLSWPLLFFCLFIWF